ncbi:hypothetical protein KCP71_19975 [Salmonella enterica subsp. enterica]|nr:hypothetical protein KCP71_19975 [Salmonella enterica subsp. enterica]
MAPGVLARMGIRPAHNPGGDQLLLLPIVAIIRLPLTLLMRTFSAAVPFSREIWPDGANH